MRTARLLAVVLVVVVLAVLLNSARHRWRGAYQAPPRTFDGSSNALKRTVVVPTLDTPAPDGKSAIWCSTFGLAWRRMATDVFREPLRVSGADEVAGRLNRLTDPEADLPRNTYYAAAGRVADGIVERIRRGMKAQFPRAAPPDLGAASRLNPNSLVCYSYLEAGLRFDKPYMEYDEPLVFHNADGAAVPVTSFGLREKDVDASYRDLRSQVEVLYSSADRPGRQPSEFALDLCRTSRDVQVIVALVPRRATLAESVAYVEKQRRDVGSPVLGPRLGSDDTLRVPNLSWRLDHHFRELEGHGLMNGAAVGGATIIDASQTIAFHLDRSGAGVESESRMLAIASIPVNYVFDRPFLIYLKKRGAEHPFFAMWVDNAELLSKWPTRGGK